MFCRVIFKTKNEKIIFFKYTGKQSKYETELDFYGDVEVSMDYDAAEHIRDRHMDSSIIDKVKTWLKIIR